MPFSSPIYNAPTTIEKFYKEGCKSQNNETNEICGSTEGYQLVGGPDYIVFQCTNCHIANVLYKDQETMERCTKEGIGITKDGAISMSLSLDKKEVEEMTDKEEITTDDVGNLEDILPDLKRTGGEINFYFRKKEYGWLSNFERCDQKVGADIYQTNEHWYQASKAKEPDIHQWIRNAPNPFLAMKAGRSLRPGKELDPNWESIKFDVMYIGLQTKFEDPELRKKLLATGDAWLHEDSPTDMIWGKKGLDRLGKLLMQVREKIRKEVEK